MKYIQDENEEPNPIQRRMLQQIETQQIRETLMSKAQKYKDKVKVVFDKRANQQTFQENDLVLRWDIRREDRGKHGKFDNLWFGPFRIAQVLETILLY